MLRQLGVVLFVALMLAGAGCQPVMPQAAPAAVEPVAAQPEATAPPEQEAVATEPPAEEPVVTGPLRILFVDDWYIQETWSYVAHFAAIAAAADPPVEIETQRVILTQQSLTPEEIIGSASLQRLWEGGVVMDALHAGHWDWVVFHQDMAYAMYALDTTPDALATFEQTYVEYAAKFAGEVEQAGAKMALVVPWNRRSGMLTTLDDLVRINEEAAAASGAIVIPVGLAWQRARQIDPAFELYRLDDERNFHEYLANVDGEFLTAAVVYATLLDRNPADLPYVPSDVLPDTGPASALRKLWKEADEHAPFLQQMAWETVQEYKSR